MRLLAIVLLLFPQMAFAQVRFGASGWLEAIVPGSESDTFFTSLSPLGRSAGVFGTRSSDNPGAGSQGGFAVGLFAINDNVSAPQTTYGLYVEARRFAGVTGITQGIETDVINLGAQNADISPWFLGTVINYWASAGRTDLPGANPNDLALGIVNNGSQFNAGIGFQVNSLTGGENGASAIIMPPQYAIKWFSSVDHRANAFIRSDASAAGAAGQVGIVFSNSGFSTLLQDGSLPLVVGHDAVQVNSIVSAGGITAVLPTSPSGLAPGALWRDPADGNRIKGVP